MDAVNLWIGNKNSVSSMHKDPYENLYAVVEGKKIFEICHPMMLCFMEYEEYDTFSWREGRARSRLEEAPKEDASEPPKEDASNLKSTIFQNWHLKNENFKTNWLKSIKDTDKVKIYKVEIEPGDLFYLPAFWFHKVSQEDMTLAVNYWYDVDYLGPSYGMHEVCKKLVVDA